MSGGQNDTVVKRKRSTRELMLRMFSALSVLACIFGSLWYDTVNGCAWGWTVVLTVASVFAIHEFYRLGADTRPFHVLGYTAALLWTPALELDLSGQSMALAGLWFSPLVFLYITVGAMLWQLTRRDNETALAGVSLSVFGFVYCAVLPSLTLVLRHMAFGPGGWPMDGVEFAVVCIYVSKVSDVGALMTGSRWGRHKLIPRLSPGKTWEGAAGGLLFSIALLLFMVWIEPRMALARLSWPWLVLLSFWLAAAGLAGDLIESGFKRNSHRKDAGEGVPGFGGVLDLTDSMMIATPAFYLFLLAFGARLV